MDTHSKNSVKIVIFVLAITIVFNSSLVQCKNDLVQWDECTDLLVQLRNCSPKLHVPQNCANIQKSELLQCAENVMSNISFCKDPMAITMIKNYVKMYQLSDKILCQDRFSSSFSKDKDCTAIARSIAVYIGGITPKSLTEKGCKISNSFMYSIALPIVKKDCYKLLIEYVEALFKETSCGSLKIKPPSIDELKDFKVALHQIIVCWAVHSDLPTCKKDKSKRLKCVKKIDTKDLNKHFVPLFHNIVAVSKETDKAICKDKNLKKELANHEDCWQTLKGVGSLVISQANGLLTKEGCKAIKYRENITIASVNKNCGQLLLDYKRAMDKILPCVPGFATSLHANRAVLLFLPSLFIILKLIIG